MWLVRLLQAIPAVIWSGALGASIALLGTALQNRAHRNNQKAQLTHDAEQRRKEREMTLRRDVYLRAATAIAQMQKYLSDFPNLLLSEQQHTSQLAESVVTLHQVELVGSLETLRLMGSVRSCFNRRSLDLIARRQLAQQLADRVNDLKRAIESHSQEREQLSGVLQSPSAAKDEQLRKSFIQKFEQITAVIDQETASENQLALEFADHQRDLILATIDALAEVGTFIAPVVVEIRRELDFTIDADGYLQIFSESDDLAKKHVTKMIEDLKASSGRS